MIPSSFCFLTLLCINLWLSLVNVRSCIGLKLHHSPRCELCRSTWHLHLPLWIARAWCRKYLVCSMSSPSGHRTAWSLLAAQRTMSKVLHLSWQRRDHIRMSYNTTTKMRARFFLCRNIWKSTVLRTYRSLSGIGGVWYSNWGCQRLSLR
jgi:hypothetical protein